jgi:magnesium transporter
MDPAVTQDLQEHLDRGDVAAAAARCAQLHPATVADFVAALAPDRAVGLLGALEVRRRAEVFAALDERTQDRLAAELDTRQLAGLVGAMAHDERADLLPRLPEDRAVALLRSLAESEREDMRRLAAHPDGTAGAVMTSEYATLRPELTVREALDRLRVEAPDRETIYYAYVVDDARRLVGLVSLKKLILAPPQRRVIDLMRREVISVRADEPQAEAARRLSRYDLLAIPVVNHDDVLVGIITFDDVLDVVEAEATTDFQRIAPAGLMRESLREASPWLLVRKRLPWLLVLVFVNIFSGAGIAAFEETIQAVVALVFFLPLLIDSGGNAGSQSATLMVRALATGDVGLRDWTRLLGKETAVALMMGLAMAAAVSVIGLVRAPEVTLVVALSMLAIVLVGTLVGMSLPFVFARLGLDPATASAPLITSLADISGVVIYFGLATWLLGPAP